MDIQIREHNMLKVRLSGGGSCLRSLCAVLAGMLFFVVYLSAAAEGRELTDIFGRKALVPDRIRRAYSTAIPLTYMLYAIDPAILAGLNVRPREWEKRYLRKEMVDLPVLGGWFGQGNVPNMEMILKVHPEIILTWGHGKGNHAKQDEILRNVPMPVASVTLDKLSDYPSAFTRLGQVLGYELRAKKLSAYAGKTIREVAGIVNNIPKNRRITVYYAEGADGLSTECDTSGHAELIEMSGGRNVHRCLSKDFYGMEKVSLEQVIMYDPEVILAFEKAFFNNVFSDARWRQIKAVRGKRVYLIPKEPFNWFDRPPSLMRLLGLKWLTNLLYPGLYRVDIAKETQIFFKLFFNVNLSREEALKIVNP